MVDKYIQILIEREELIMSVIKYGVLGVFGLIKIMLLIFGVALSLFTFILSALGFVLKATKL